jgi:hypothetical protein
MLLNLACVPLFLVAFVYVAVKFLVNTLYCVLEVLCLPNS